MVALVVVLFPLVASMFPLPYVYIHHDTMHYDTSPHPGPLLSGPGTESSRSDGGSPDL